MVSVVVSLIHDAQEIAILTGKEVLNLDTLNEAYQQRLTLLHGYIQPSVIQNKPTTKKKKTAASVKKNQSAVVKQAEEQANYSISEIAEKAKTENLDVVELLKEVYTVIEVAI